MYKCLNEREMNKCAIDFRTCQPLITDSSINLMTFDVDNISVTSNAPADAFDTVGLGGALFFEQTTMESTFKK